MSEGPIKNKASKTAGLVVLILILASTIAGLLLTTNLNSSQPLSAAGQIVNQYSSNTQSIPTATVVTNSTVVTNTNTAVPEFSFNPLWVIVGVIALLWGSLVLVRRQKSV